MEKVLVSSCLLGQPVRYDGQAQRLNDPFISQLCEQQRVVSFCPEVAGGLPTPRDAAEILMSQIITVTGVDVSDEFARGAKLALAHCLASNIRFALLKESSPSCGRNTIYDGSFTGNKVAGMGWTAKLLEQNGIRVFSEEQIPALSKALRSL
ncbi:DUF523 domain-containing protein [Pseudoalteromonas aurantia]|uniref:DUF523 domain-containing protein n=1 Tax=Pseudoalteromonas aurantia 208 TaxID=1314867 RepID=A0ABR9EFN9_9GAMM|nr:DUF523 domain-containing protein [Pseudoalteromonas aurantia]MBE0369780.1 hypothetical protein [Pseudoalteromonas aurantia 208]